MIYEAVLSIFTSSTNHIISMLLTSKAVMLHANNVFYLGQCVFIGKSGDSSFEAKARSHFNIAHIKSCNVATLQSIMRQKNPIQATIVHCYSLCLAIVLNQHVYTGISFESSSSSTILVSCYTLLLISKAETI